MKPFWFALLHYTPSFSPYPAVDTQYVEHVLQAPLLGVPSWVMIIDHIMVLIAMAWCISNMDYCADSAPTKGPSRAYIFTPQVSTSKLVVRVHQPKSNLQNLPPIHHSS